jgi:hypothetical protein
VADGQSGNFYHELIFRTLILGEDHNYGLGWNIEKCLIDLGLRPGRKGAEKYIFAVLLPTLGLHEDRLEGGGDVSNYFLVGRVGGEPTAR